MLAKALFVLKKFVLFLVLKHFDLKTGDVIVGIRGEVFNGSVEELLDIFDEIDEEDGGILTIWREGFSLI